MFPINPKQGNTNPLGLFGMSRFRWVKQLKSRAPLRTQIGAKSRSVFCFFK